MKGVVVTNPSLRRRLATPCIQAIWITAAMLMTVSCSSGDGMTTPTTGNVSLLVDSVRIEPDCVEMVVGDTVELRALVFVRSIASIPEVPLDFDFVPQWLVSDTNVVTLGSLDGSLTGFSFVIASSVLVEARGVGGTTVVASAGQGTEVVSDTAMVIVR